MTPSCLQIWTYPNMTAAVNTNSSTPQHPSVHPSRFPSLFFFFGGQQQHRQSSTSAAIDTTIPSTTLIAAHTKYPTRYMRVSESLKKFAMLSASFQSTFVQSGWVSFSAWITLSRAMFVSLDTSATQPFSLKSVCFVPTKNNDNITHDMTILV